jgi:uncharacterized damage-inducible protein DinB
MAKSLEPMIGELQQEAATTRRVLDRVPGDKLTWKPHPKSMTIGQLANHIALIPGNISRMAQASEFDAANANFNPPQPASVEELKATLDAGVQSAQDYLTQLSDADAMATWRLTMGDKEVMSVPRAGMLRAILFNHWYHHRGQLSVYLRLLDVPVPIIYGRSADESPFA